MPLGYDKSLRRRLISTTLVILALVSLFQGYLNALPFLPENWHVPIIFVSLVVVLEFISELSTDLSENGKKVEKSVNNTERIYSFIQNSEFTEVEVYRDYDQHFRDVSKQLERTSGKVSLTHVQTDPPDSFGSAAVNEYYSRTEEWLEKNPDGQVKRIISISNESMYEWAQYLEGLSEEYERFRVRVCTWESEFPMINMALLDATTAYFALTFGHAKDTRCLRIEDTEVVEMYEQYFGYMWRQSESLSEAIKKHEETSRS